MADMAISPAVGAVADVPPVGLERPDFQIVPRAGLPMVAVVLGLLIAGIAVNTAWPLQFLHVVGGAAWTVIDLFLGFVLGPIIGRLSIPAQTTMPSTLRASRDGISVSPAVGVCHIISMLRCRCLMRCTVAL